MLLSICSSDMEGTPDVALFTEDGATLEEPIGADEGGAPIFVGPIMVGGAPMGGNIGAGVLRCDDDVDESFEDRCWEPDLDPRPSYLL